MTKQKIVCIDDDPFYQDLYKTILEGKGYAVSVAGDALKGYELAKKVKPDLVILDVMMPEKGGFRDGFDLLKRLKSEKGMEDLPCIMISGLSSPNDVHHGDELGAAKYVGKQDLRPDTLVELVKEMLDKK
jgi:DNA-binding response OmpR family regulator